MKTRVALGGVVFMAACLTVPAMAQDEDVTRLEETEIETRDVKLVADGLDIQVLQDQMTFNIEDSVRYIPGVQVNDVGNRFGDDGFNIRGLEGDFVAITIDGVDQGETLNPPGFSAYGMFGSSRGAVEIETVKAIRLTRGASSVTDGNGSLAGSVTYVTKDPSDFLAVADDTHFGLSTGLDSRNDEILYSFSFANRSGPWETLLIGAARDGHEMEAHDDGADIAGSERGQADPVDRTEYSVLAKLNYNLSDSQTLGFVFEMNDRDADVLPLSRESDAYYGFTAVDTSDRLRAGLSYGRSALDTAFVDSIDVSLDYQTLETSGRTTFGFANRTLDDPLDDYLRTEDRSFDQELVRLAIDFDKSFQTGAVYHSLVYGLEYQDRNLVNELFDIRRETLDPTSPLRSFTVDPTWIPETDVNRISVYARDEMQLTDALTAVAGLRYDRTEYNPKVGENFTDPTGDTVQDADYSAVVGELGLRYAITDRHAVGVSVGQGFKAPTIQDMFYGASSGFITDVNTGEQFADYDELSNPSLDPERSTNYELTYEFNSDRVRIRLTGFLSEYDELIQSVSNSRSYGTDVTFEVCRRGRCEQQTVSEDVFVQANNVGSVDVSGFEFDSRFRLTDSLSMSLAYSHVDGEHNEDDADGFSHEAGDELATISPDSAVLGLNYRAQSGDWGVSSYVVHTAAKDDPDDQSINSLNNGSGVVFFPDSWTTVDLFGYYQIGAQRNARVSLAVRNLFDENYIRWEVINSVREGDGGFFGGATVDPGSGINGAARFSDPGRSYAINLTIDF